MTRLSPHEAAVEASLIAYALDQTPHAEEAYAAHCRAARCWALIEQITRVASVRDNALAKRQEHLLLSEDAVVRALAAKLGSVSESTKVLA